MIFLAVGALALGAAVGAGVTATRRALGRLQLPFEPDELHWARTADGWELPMGRYLPLGPRAVKEPVILCHGLGANRFNLDLNERYSVARYLAKRGYECFVVELRGSGIARRWSPGRHYSFNFDDLAQTDVPAMIGKAREVSGAERVLWVGHSKGGIVQYAYCGMGIARPEIAGVVAVGSPLVGHETFSPNVKRVMIGATRLMLLDAIYTAPVVKALAPMREAGLLPAEGIRYLASAANIDRDVSAWAMANLLGNMSTGVTRQFALWMETGRFTSWDRTIDYEAGLATSRVPFLLLAGTHDRLGTPDSLRAAKRAMRDADAAGLVEFVLAGKEHGYSCDYGHGDLILGRCAPDEIFPAIEGWLRRRGTAC